MADERLSVASLRCEDEINPLGIDVSRPRLSWKYRPSKRGRTQSAFEVLVYSRLEDIGSGNAADLWSSGRIESESTIGVVYDGQPLASGQPAYWMLRAWDDDGKAIESTEPGFWETGLLNPADWKAKWIAALSPTGLRIDSGHLRSEFTCDQAIRRARLYASAQGIYVGFLNGRRIGDSYFRPGWTDYNKRIQYQTYDITALINQGENAIGFILGDGWFCGELGWKGERNLYGKTPHLMAQLEIEFMDGSTKRVITDGQWKVAAGSILSSDFLMGETYDARREMTGWATPEFNDYGWRNAKEGSAPSAMLVGQSGPPVRKLMELRPKTVTPGAGGTYVFDLGQNMVGWARLRVRGAAGSTIILRFAEMLNRDGTIYTDNLRRARSVDQYTLKGGGEEIYEPSFTFHGFRYVEISGFVDEPTLDTITGIVVGSSLPSSGTFECSNPLLNQLQSNIVWGQRGNFLEVPTDCPQRDERLGWMADAQIFLPTATFNMDCNSFIRKWMQDVLDAQSPEGAFSDVSPRISHLADGAPAWGDAGVIVPWTIYQAYGDRGILEKCFGAMAKWIEYIREANPNLVWVNRVSGNMGDWVNIQAETPKDLLATAYFAQSTAIVARAARVLNREEDVLRYEKLWEQIKEVFIRTYVSDEGDVRGATQTGYVLALRFDLLPAHLRAAAANRLVERVREKNNQLSTGFVGVGHLLFALSESGHPDVAYKLILNETFPSWGYSIRHGATTIWERWNGWTNENGFFDPEMNSFNHYAFGSVGQWMYESIAGIRVDPKKPGYEHIILRPQPGGGLMHASASLDSVRGLIESNWQLKDGAFRWHVKIPPTATATAFMPTTNANEILESGNKVTEMDDIKLLESREHLVLLGLSPGSYDFTFPWSV